MEHSVSDIYYVPNKLFQQFVVLEEILLQELLVELVVPLILTCLDSDLPRVELEGVLASVNSSLRHQPQELLMTGVRHGKTFVHPVKWSPLIEKNGTVLKGLLCNMLLPWIYN